MLPIINTLPIYNYNYYIIYIFKVVINIFLPDNTEMYDKILCIIIKILYIMLAVPARRCPCKKILRAEFFFGCNKSTVSNIAGNMIEVQLD